MIGSCAVISNSAAARLQKSKIEIKRKIVRVDRPNPLLMVTFSQTPQFQDDFTKSFVQMWDNANLLHFISTQIVSMARFYCRNNRKKCNYSIQKGVGSRLAKRFLQFGCTTTIVQSWRVVHILRNYLKSTQHAIQLGIQTKAVIAASQINNI